MAELTNKCAVVTGANKGIGLEICTQLASKGITVVLTARDEKRGIEAVEKLKGQFGLSDFILFHQLDVAHPSTIASLAEFINSKFGKLDILINNAGIGGANVDGDALKASLEADPAGGVGKVDWIKISNQTYDLAVECIETNYQGTKYVTQALLPLLHQSQSPTIVNVSSAMARLKNIPNEWAKGVFQDIENLSEERIDEVLNEFLKDMKEGMAEAKGWPKVFGAYTVSKVAMNAYTRLLAKRYPNMKVNCVCPGFVKTDINFNTGVLTVEQGASTPVRLALLPQTDDAPSGLFFVKDQVASFDE